MTQFPKGYSVLRWHWSYYVYLQIFNFPLFLKLLFGQWCANKVFFFFFIEHACIYPRLYFLLPVFLIVIIIIIIVFIKIRLGKTVTNEKVKTVLLYLKSGQWI